MILTALIVVFGIFTAWAVVLNLFAADRIAANIQNSPTWAASGIRALGAIGILSIVALIAIWKWRRWGAYLYGVLAVPVLVLNILMLNGMTPFMGALGAATVIFFVSRKWQHFE